MMMAPTPAVALGLHSSTLDKPLVLRSARLATAMPVHDDDTARADRENGTEQVQAPEPVIPDLPNPDAPKADESKIRHRSAVISWSPVVPVYPPDTDEAAKGDYDVLYELQLVQVGIV
jgi:hypothetical protein